MKCCGKEMFDNADNYRCNVCGKRIYKQRKPSICPGCKSYLFDNGNNVHCAKCGYRKYFN